MKKLYLLPIVIGASCLTFGSVANSLDPTEPKSKSISHSNSLGTSLAEKSTDSTIAAAGTLKKGLSFSEKLLSPPRSHQESLL